MRKEPVNINVPELKDVLERYLEADSTINYAIKIVGHPGIGKSDVVRQTARAKNFLFIDTRLAFKENIDLGGYPVPDHEAERMVYYRPGFIPPPEVPEGYEGVLWFLDEANRAHPTVIQTLFQIITEGVCGEHKLPDQTFVVLAGNLGELDNTAITEFDDSALDGRLAIFHLKPDAENWLQWASQEAIHPSIIRYISQFPERLWDEVSVNPNPRGWHQASQAIMLSYGLNSEEELEAHLNSDNGSSLEKMLTSLVGRTACSDFALQITSPRLLTTREVLAGDREKISLVRSGGVSPEDVLWALSGALDELRDISASSNGEFKGRDMETLSSVLQFIGLLRADMRVSFFFTLVKQCAVFSQLPRALDLIEDRSLASEIREKFGEFLAE